ncbi:zinc metalloprotease HtpX [Halorubellus sp. PRR65]|uniref:zinc metalloprotease HtpX n=1 Tax=Halorubellus sp. PRR65 TaxID=3098148 RepID=UPI002B25EE4A|nr:zinc metalloprotease HtpX [Halorubellus sp. PRR65]
MANTLPTDRGLQARMALTVVLLAALYAGFVGVLVLVDAGILVSIVVMGALLGGQFLLSDRLALRAMGARTVDTDEYPHLHAVVSRLSQQADLPKPAVAVAQTKTPNAFAAGRSQSAATVCVTTGLLETLDDDELEAVVAHELAHVKNRDVMIMTVASFFSAIAMFVLRWGWLFGGGDDENPSVLVAMVASFVVWILSFLLMRALSRYREFAADRGAVAITGRPSALASALQRIDNRMDAVPTRDARENAEMNAFFIQPLKGGTIGRLFSTHPSTESRVERLQDLERSL